MIGKRGAAVALLAVILALACPPRVAAVEVEVATPRRSGADVTTRGPIESNEISPPGGPAWPVAGKKESNRDASNELAKFDEVPAEANAREPPPAIEVEKATNASANARKKEAVDNSGLRGKEDVKPPTTCGASDASLACLRTDLERFVDDLSRADTYNLTEFAQLARVNLTRGEITETSAVDGDSLLDKVHRFAREHVLRIKVPKDIVASRGSRMFFGAFGLKKLLLPLFIGAQIVKSILLALFLPSILGSIGKIAAKGLTSFAQNSQTNAPQPEEENFEFKDNFDSYNPDDLATRQPIGTLPASAMYDDRLAPQKAEMISRYGLADPRIAHANVFSDRYYSRHTMGQQGFAKKQDYKVFHEIPSSSLLLTNYDPFYSPLLSRLDAVFSRLGHTSEGCREYAICAMYRSPARYAPYSNLVSAQLSRELNELRKPSSDNPDVLRFFRYMKAAKDGQDGVRCEEIYTNCAVPRDDPTRSQNQAMLATYQDIDKLVHARRL